MKPILKSIIFLALAGLLTSCFYSMPVAREVPRNNQTYQVDYLFEHDGCKVYRFYDRGNYVYFTNCQGNLTSIKDDTTKTRVTNSVKIQYEDYPTQSR